MKSLYLFGLIALVAAALHGQTYWSTSQPACSGTGASGAPVQGPVTITTPSGGTGYSCYVSGTFIWFAAGGAWGTQIRVAAPESGAIAAQYTFLSMKGALLPLNTATNGGSAATSSSNSLALALNANQPIEVDLLGPTGGFTNLQDGSVYAQFLCPDAATCMDVAPQLIYSALPTTPYSLSVPITWDGSEQYRWSVVGINDGNVHHLSFAIYNADTTATAAVSYTVQVYDDTGTLVGTGTTPAIPQQITAGSYGAAGVWAAQDLSNVLPSTTTLPSGPLKVVFSGPDRFDVMAIQFIDGPIGQSAATTLQVAPTPGSSASSASLRRANVSRVASTPRPVFGALAE